MLVADFRQSGTIMRRLRVELRPEFQQNFEVKPWKDTKQVNSQYMNRVSERIQQVLMEYVTRNYPDHEGRFLQLIMKLPELRAVR